MSEESRARTAVARLELISHGCVRNYQGDGRGGEGSGVPAGGIGREDRKLSHVWFRGELARCVTTADFSRVADAADRAQLWWSKSKLPPADSPAWKDKVAADTRKTRVVAADYKISRSYVRLIRQAARVSS